MSIYNQISILVFLLIAFGLYKLLKSKSKKSESRQALSEEDLKPFLSGINLDSEEKVRKQWLVSLFIFTGISALSSLITYFGESSFKELSEYTGIAFSILFGLFVSAVALIPLFWITYHCAYKKRGTAWIMWIMISLPLGELSDIAKGGWSQSAEWDSTGWIMVMTFLVVEVYFWINCLRLRRVNSEREYQKVLALKAKYGSDANGFC